jgi:hypothetical protein
MINRMNAQTLQHVRAENIYLECVYMNDVSTYHSCFVIYQLPMCGGWRTCSRPETGSVFYFFAGRVPSPVAPTAAGEGENALGKHSSALPRFRGQGWIGRVNIRRHGHFFISNTQGRQPLSFGIRLEWSLASKIKSSREMRLDSRRDGANW